VTRPPGRIDRIADELGRMPLLAPAGGVYLTLGVVLAVVWTVGDVDTSLFPTGWLLPAVLIVTGALMLIRRRFDLVGTLWGALALAVFLLDMAVYIDSLSLGVNDPGAFDPTIVVAALALVPLVLRPQFRRSPIE
jgi:hypothetical protein